MPKTQILVMVLIAAAVGAAVAQAPQGSLTGVVGNDAASVVAMNHRTVAIGGQDMFVGNVWGRAIDGGTVFKGEKVTVQTSTFPSPCLLKIWVAIKQGNNGNRLQQRTVRNNGTGMFMMPVRFNGHLVLTVQQQVPAAGCAVATDVHITAAPAT